MIEMVYEQTEAERAKEWVDAKVDALKNREFVFDDDSMPVAEYIGEHDIHIYHTGALRKLAELLGVVVVKDDEWSKDVNDGTWWWRVSFYYRGVEFFSVGKTSEDEKLPVLSGEVRKQKHEDVVD